MLFVRKHCFWLILNLIIKPFVAFSMFTGTAMMIGILIVYFTTREKRGMFFSFFHILPIQYNKHQKLGSSFHKCFGFVVKNCNLSLHSTSICSKTDYTATIKFYALSLFSVFHCELTLTRKRAIGINIKDNERDIICEYFSE